MEFIFGFAVGQVVTVMCLWLGWSLREYKEEGK